MTVRDVVTDDALAASVFEAAAKRWREKFELARQQRDLFEVSGARWMKRYEEVVMNNPCVLGCTGNPCVHNVADEAQASAEAWRARYDEAYARYCDELTKTDTAAAQRDRAWAVVRDVEWGGSMPMDPSGTIDVCPDCKGDIEAHFDNCDLAAVVAEADGEE